MEDSQKVQENKQDVIWWCRVVVKRPKLMFGLTLGGHLLMCVITGILLAAKYDILPIVFNSLPLQIDHDKYFLRNEAVSYRGNDLDSDDELEPEITKKVIDNTDTRRRKRSAENMLRISLQHFTESSFDSHEQSQEHVSRRWIADTIEDEEHAFQRVKRDADNSSKEESDVYERRYTLTSIQIIYEMEGGNVFTRENLRTMAKFEYDLFRNETFQKKYCQLMKIFGTYQCRPFRSVLRFFDGSVDSDLYDPSFTDAGGTLARAYAHERHGESLKYYLGINTTVTNSTLQSDITRTYMYYGHPYPENIDQWKDSRSKEMNILKRWFYKDVIPRLKNHFENGIDKMKLLFMGNNLYFEEAFRQVFLDWYWLLGSVLFIFLFMWFQTSSLWITGWGLLSVVTCFVSGNLVYNLIFDFKFFGIFNVLAIFIVLGVGADDIFVFVDTWRLLEGKSYTLEERLSECYRRAAATMLVTSLTTMVAFFVSGFSPLLSVSAFGVFAGTTILVNYISVIVFFPTVVITHHLYFEKNVCCCCTTCCCSPKPRCIASDYEEDAELPRNKSTENLQKPSDEDKKMQGSKIAIISRFFAGPFFYFVTHKVIKWIIIVISLGLTAGAVYFSSTLEADTDSHFKVFREHNVFEVARRKMSNAFMENSGDNKVKVNIYWGLDLQDRSDCPLRRWDQWCEGTTVWDEGFDLNKGENQLALLDFCHELKDKTSSGKEELQIRTHPDDPSINDVECFIDDMANFFKVNVSNKYPNISIGIPITRENLRELVHVSPEVFRSDAMDYISRPFEIAYQYWIKGGYGVFDFNDDEKDVIGSHRGRVGLRTIGRTNLLSNDTDNKNKEFYQSKMKFAGIQITTVETSRRLYLTKGLELMKKWEDYVNEKMETMPTQLKKGWQQSSRWDWFTVQESLAQQGVMGIGIGLALSFVIIFIGTLNIIIALLSTLVLGCVSAFVIAVIPIGGWKLGLLEALNLCLVVGLSVDYIVHLAEAYHLANAVTRLERTRDALEKVGVSILSGALTTLGASFFMFFAEILFFMQFGMFIFCTIGFSMLLSLFFFSALLCTFGPENNQGSIKPWVDKAKRYFFGCKKRKINNQQTQFKNDAFEEDRTDVEMK